MRVNKPTPAHLHPMTGDRANVAVRGKGFVRREPREGEAPPRTISVMTGRYVPAPLPPVRPGADDHKQFTSKGYRT